MGGCANILFEIRKNYVKCIIRKLLLENSNEKWMR